MNKTTNYYENIRTIEDLRSFITEICLEHGDAEIIEFTGEVTDYDESMDIRLTLGSPFNTSEYN